MERCTGDVAQATAALHALDPQAVLRRGFAHLSLLGATQPLRTVGDVTAGDQVTATLADGSVTAWVTNVSASPTVPTRGTS